jgi:tetratricopeptide (TPR) repeat protein
VGAQDDLTSAATLDAAASPLPKSFGSGRYLPRQILGVGGQKVVYLVDDTKLERRCALAFMAEPTAGDQRERFEREARAVARLGSHPNVVAVFDVGEENAQPFIVSELMTGGDLRARLERGPLATEQAIAIARDVLDALAFVHKNGLVHRDLKPENVWLTEDGHAKLGDFGIALVSDRPRLSATGALVGTPAYLAPEQLLGDRIDGRADLYSLGVMLHELVTGKPLFAGEVVAVLSQHLYAQPAPASEIEASVPKGLERFILRLLSKAPDDRPPTAAEARAELERAATALVSPAHHDPLRTLAHAAFVGREAEVATLKTAFERALRRQPSFVLVAGEPGIGKTRLSQELALHARLRGARVLVGRCNEAEGTPPYLPFMDALDGFLATETTESLRARLGEDAATLRELLPRAAARLETASLTSRIDRHALFQAVMGVLRRCAGDHGLLLVVEDVQWADKASLLLLKHLVENIGGAPIMVVVTYRDVEVGKQHPLASVLADLRRNPAVERIHLRGLDAASVRALLDGAGDAPAWSPTFSEELCARTEGNPLFIQEVLKQLVAAGGAPASHPTLPEGIRDAIKQRLSRLGEACNRMLARAAVIGGTFSWEVLTGVAEQDEDVLLDLLDEALASQIVREKRYGKSAVYEFTHTLVRETLYEEINVPRRARLHRQVAEAIERIHRASLDAHVAELAHHYLHSSDAEKAIEYSTRAGDRAVLQVGYEEAASHYARALETVDALDTGETEKAARRCDLHARRARAFTMSAAYDSARAELDRAIALAPSEARRGELLAERAAASQFAMDIPGVARAADELLAIGTKLGRDDLERAGQMWRAVALLAEGNTAKSIATFERVVSEGYKEQHLVAASHFSLTLYWAGHHREALECTKRVLELARRTNDVTAIMFALPHRALALASLGRYTEALATFDEAREFGTKHGNQALVARVHSMLGGTYLSLSDYEHAEACAEEARALARAASFQPPVVSSGFDLAFIAVRRGDSARAVASLDGLQKAAETAGAWHGWVWLMRLDELRAEIALAAGDARLAVDSATSVLERATLSGRPRYRVWARCIRAAARAKLGEDAKDDLDASLTEARATGEAPLLLHAMRASLQARPDASLLAEARSLRDAIAASHPDETTRTRFLERAVI